MARLKLPYLLKVVRLVFTVMLFISGCLSIVITQYVGVLLFHSNADLKQAWLNFTKRNFVVLLTFITQIVVPTKLSIQHDASIPLGSFQCVNSNLLSALASKSVTMSNHQLYTDWLFLWFFAYTANLGDSVFIMLKDLSNIPILGQGMKNYNFLFLSRKWEKDRVNLANQLNVIDANARGLGPANGVKVVATKGPTEQNVITWPEGHNNSKTWPYDLILFPEGTVLSAYRRGLSEAFTEKKGAPFLKHLIFPRARGLLFSLRRLRHSTDCLYDLTTAYSGLAADKYGEDEFTMSKFFFHGDGPERVNIYIQRFKLDDIPLGNDDIDSDDELFEKQLKIFEDWLFHLWYEKDKKMSNFYKYGTFVPDGIEAVEPVTGIVRSDVSKPVVGKIQLTSIFEIFNVFIVPVTVGLLVRVIWLLIRMFL